MLLEGRRFNIFIHLDVQYIVDRRAWALSDGQIMDQISYCDVKLVPKSVRSFDHGQFYQLLIQTGTIGFMINKLSLNREANQ